MSYYVNGIRTTQSTKLADRCSVVVNFEMCKFQGLDLGRGSIGFVLKVPSNIVALFEDVAEVVYSFYISPFLQKKNE